MCGRYVINTENKTMSNIIFEAEYNSGIKLKSGEIFPTDFAPIIINDNSNIKSTAGKWGLRLPNKKLLINTKSETVLENNFWKYKFLYGRCLIPCNGFYEWDKNKNKFLFNNSDVLYLGGVFEKIGETYNYSILTTDANKTLVEIHNRMPLIIEKDNINNWFTSLEKSKGYLQVYENELIKSSIF